ncbi:MAG: aminotransferase class V-fold PLP-dependent enzyme, partial [Pseudomonadota bacterium]
MSRVYLDWNATAPLRPEARAAMLAAMDVVGNPSSVHAEGRAARAAVEKARWQVAQLVGADPSEVIFTGSATEAAAIWFYNRDAVCGAEIEHDAVLRQVVDAAHPQLIPCNRTGVVARGDILPVAEAGPADTRRRSASVLQAANSETGVIQPLLWQPDPGFEIGLSDITQAVGRLAFSMAHSPARACILSAHKLGGPKGVGALVAPPDVEIYSPLSKRPWAGGDVGGGQEMGRRA